MRRRHVLALLAAAAAAPGSALADDAKQPLTKAFAFLDAYLGLPAAQRSRFYLAYRATRDKRPVSGVQAAIVAPGGARTPVAFDGAGRVTHLPSLAELKSGASFEPVGAPFKLGLELRYAGAASAHIDPAELIAALAQTNAAIAKLAGVMAAVVPKLTTAFFPDSGGGQAVLADGRTAPLLVFAAPMVGMVPYFEPAAAVGAKAVLLTRAPSRILLGSHPKKA
jgi:hypothetical protein